MNDKPQVGVGNVTIYLDGKPYELIPTLAAAQGISRLGGGIRVAIDNVLKLDIDTIAQLGLGPTVSKEFGNTLPDVVWRSGFMDSDGELASKCVEYLTVLSNGGRPFNPTEKSEVERTNANP